MANTRSVKRPVLPEQATLLPPAIPAPCVEVRHGGETMNLYLAARRRPWRSPLLLVHGIDMGASAADMRPLFEWFATPHTASSTDQERPVAALELPGYGSSSRPARALSPVRMAEAIVAAVDELSKRAGGHLVDVCALSLSCEFAALAAMQRPLKVRSLALINPTGLEGWRQEAYDQGRTRLRPLLRRLLAVPPVGQLLFRCLRTGASLRREMERCWDSPLIDESLLAHSRTCAAAPGAAVAGLAWLCGALSTRGIIEIYRRLPMPVWLGHGLRGPRCNVDALSRLTPASSWTRQSYDTGSMPHFEHRQLFCSHYTEFLRGLDQSRATAS